MLSCVQLFVTPWTAACQASLSIIISRSLLKVCPLSRWCHPIISSSIIPFSSCLQSFPASGSFPINQFFTSGGQSIRVSASTSVLPILWPPDMKNLTHLKRPWCWERLKAGGEGDNREWDGWKASPTRWTWVRVNSVSWWWTRRPGVLQSMRL